MNTCSNCGKPIQAGMARCQYCGKPVTATSGQPELPAWLETLRAGDQSTSSSTGVGGASDLSPDDFVDESLLPSWMQADRNDAVDNNPSDAYQLRRSASTSAPNTDNAFIPAKGMSASSFIDEQFLPSWLQEKQVATPNVPQENIAASSLIQQDALPDWIKAVSPQQTPSVTQPVTLYGQQDDQANPVRPPQGIAGNDLIDQQAVPQWMGMAGQNNVVSTNGQSGFAASSLIDKDALPPWIHEHGENGREQRNGNASSIPPFQTPQVPYGQPASYQLPFGQVQAHPSQPLQPSQPSQPSFVHDQMQAPPPQQRPNEQQVASAHQSLSASSFIDVDSLPDWLRSPGDIRPGATPTPSSSPMQKGGVDHPRQATFGVPPRSEYVRVPSRPRNEPGSYEESAVAANAFASMLGVASAAPFFPGQQSRDGVQGQGQMPIQVQQPQNMPEAPMGNGVGMPGTSSSNPSSTWQQGAMNYASPAGHMAQQPGQSFAPVAPVAPVPPATGYQNGYAANSANGMNSMPGMQQEIPVSSNGGQSKTQGKPAKRGFLSTILDWFSR